MSIEEKIKAPQGRFAVVARDMRPRMEPPQRIIEVKDTAEEALQYARQKEEEWRSRDERVSAVEAAVYLMDGRGRFIEPDYIVVDDNGEIVRGGQDG